MTKHAPQAHRSGSPASSQTPPWVNAQVPDSFARAAEACASVCQEWQQEMTRFTSTRLQRDSEFGHKLVACRDWMDAAKLQQEWGATLMQDYLNEANRMFQLASKTSAEAMLSLGADSRLSATERAERAAE